MSPRRIRVFISYSHADEGWKNRLVRHLRVFAAEGDIMVWDDSAIEAGSDWMAAIDEALSSADVAILLISADFLISPFIRQHEVARILERRRQDGLRVAPLLVAPCAWTAVDWLAGLQVRPRGARPLSLGTRAQSERDLARFALEIRGFGIDDAPVAERMLHRTRELTMELPRVAWALLPGVAAISLAAFAGSVRVPTDVELQMAARTLAFTVAGDEPVQMLNNSTLLSRLTIEDCSQVELPPMRIEPAENAIEALEAPVPESPLRLRCDPAIPGSRVLFRTSNDLLGTLGTVSARQGDQVLLEVTPAEQPYIRLEISRRSSVGFVFAPQPFEIVTEFVSLDEVSTPDAAGNVRRYRAVPPDEDGERVATLSSALALKLVLVPAPAVGADRIFRSPLEVPMSTVSLFQHDDATNRFISTAITGSLVYPGQPSRPEVPIKDGNSVSVRAESGFRLTRLGLSEKADALTFSMRGVADEAQISAIDVRLTMLQAAFVNRTALLAAAAAAVLFQILWLRRFWPARSRWS